MNILILFYDEHVIFLPSFDSPGNQKCGVRLHVMHQSIPSANTPPPGQTSGEFCEVVKSPAPGQNFSAKERPGTRKHLSPGSILKDLVSFSC